MYCTFLQAIAKVDVVLCTSFTLKLPKSTKQWAKTFPPTALFCPCLHSDAYYI